MDKNTKSLEPRDKQVNDKIDLESEGALDSDGLIGFLIPYYLKRSIDAEKENFQVFHDLRLTHEEKDMEKRIGWHENKFKSELIEFSGKVSDYQAKMKEKNDLKNSIYDIIDKLVESLKSQTESFSEIGILTRAIGDNLSITEENELRQYDECVRWFAEFANRAIELFGYTEKSGEIKKVDTFDKRSVRDIAVESVAVFKFLKERGPFNPYEGQIEATAKALKEMTSHFDNICRANEELKNEEEELMRKITSLKEKIGIAEQEKATAKEKIEAEEKSSEDKLIAVISANREKQKQYVDMGKKIEFIQEQLKELPASEQKRAALRQELEENKEKLSSLQSLNERVKAAITNMNYETGDLKAKIETMEKENKEAVEEMQDSIESLELELHKKQDLAEQFKEVEDSARKEFEVSEERLANIENTFKAAKEDVRKQKAEKKQKLKDKRKLKSQIEKEIMAMELQATFATKLNKI